jgi:hypothetical protein
MTDWSREMAAKLRKKREYQAVQEAKFVEMQKMRQELGPHLWDAVKNDLRAEGKALNVELARELISERPGISNNEFVLIANLESGSCEAHILFSIEDGKLTYTAGLGKNDTFELSRGEDGKMMFYSNTISCGTGSIARQILESLLD